MSAFPPTQPTTISAVQHIFCVRTAFASLSRREDKYYAYENKYELHLNQGNDLSHLKYIYIKKKNSPF